MRQIQQPPVDHQAALYPLWLKQARQRALTDLRETQATLGRLRNVGSTYYRTVEAMVTARQRVLQTWLDMPDQLPPAGEGP